MKRRSEPEAVAVRPRTRSMDNENADAARGKAVQASKRRWAHNRLEQPIHAVVVDKRPSRPAHASNAAVLTVSGHLETSGTSMLRLLHPSRQLTRERCAHPPHSVSNLQLAPSCSCLLVQGVMDVNESAQHSESRAHAAVSGAVIVVLTRVRTGPSQAQG